MATIKLVHWSATKFHPFNQHLAGEFMHTLPGGRLSILPESSGVLQSKSPAGGGIVVTVQHNLPCPSSPITAIPVGVCIAPESDPNNSQTRYWKEHVRMRKDTFLRLVDFVTPEIS